MATRRQQELLKEARRALAGAEFRPTRVTTGWQTRMRKRQGTRHAGFRLEPVAGREAAVVVSYVRAEMLPWSLCPPEEKRARIAVHAGRLAEYGAALAAAGFRLVEMRSPDLELPSAVWTRDQEEQEGTTKRARRGQPASPASLRP